MNIEVLQKTAKELMAPKKGILASDSSYNSIKNRFDKVGIESTEENRRLFRELFYTTPGMENYISGVIMFDEAMRQNSADGISFPNTLSDKGIIPGIKVDKGAVELANFPGEKTTEGLDGLRDRLIEYEGFGARFAKWRSVIAIGEGIPTKTCLETNATVLAMYAAVCQEVDVVPVVEPEVIMDGNHEMTRTREVTEAMLKLLFTKLEEHRVYLEGMLLKINMILPGKDNPAKPDAEEVAAATVAALKEVVPDNLAGVVFLSGGQSPQIATANLNAIAAMREQGWQMTFSYERALQDESLNLWRGDPDKFEEAQKTFLKRAKLNSLARQGKYEPRMED
jgi:fructose-bisphosphate aldolase, class I